jgi:hypothetical protein
VRKALYYGTGWFLLVWIEKALLWIFLPPVAWSRARRRRRARERAELVEDIRRAGDRR